MLFIGCLRGCGVVAESQQLDEKVWCSRNSPEWLSSKRNSGIESVEQALFLRMEKAMFPAQIIPRPALRNF
jgi:hypothetical protein